MISIHNDKSYYIKQHILKDYIHDTSLNNFLKDYNVSQYMFPELTRYTSEYEMIAKTVMLKDDVLCKREIGRYVGNEINEKQLLKINLINSGSLLDRLMIETVPNILNYILDVFTILNAFHNVNICYGNPTIHNMLIDASSNIGLIDYTFMISCIDIFEITNTYNIVTYLHQNLFVYPELLYFFDMFIFAVSIKSIVIIHPNLLTFNIDNPHYMTFVAIYHVIKNVEVFRSYNVIKADIPFLKSLFMSPTYTKDNMLNKELQRISILFTKTELLNIMPSSKFWISYNIYTNLQQYFKIYDNVFNGEKLLNNEVEMITFLKPKLNCFNIFNDVSQNDLYSFIHIGNYKFNYVFLNKVPITKSIMTKVNNLFEQFVNNNFYHGSLTWRDMMIDVSDNDIQIINLSYSRILSEIEEIDGKDYIHLGNQETYEIDKRYLFFIDAFRFVASVYAIIDESIIENQNENIVLSYHLIKEHPTQHYSFNEPSIYDMSIKSITDVINTIQIDFMEEYQNKLKGFSPDFC